MQDALRLLVCVAFAAALAACKKGPEPTPQRTPAAGQNASGEPEVSPAVGVDLTWDEPSGWERLPPSNPMRQAAYRVPKGPADGEDAELTVFYFGPGQGGSIEANVQRWIGQFQGLDPGSARRADRSAHGMRQHTIEIESGTFHTGMPGGSTEPKSDYGLLGAIVEAPDGPHFFKLTGPKRTVHASREAFYKLLDSVRVRSTQAGSKSSSPGP